MAAPMHMATTGPRLCGSRQALRSCPGLHVHRDRHACQAHRRTARKLASRFFHPAPPTRTRPEPTQSLNTHQGSPAYWYGIAPGCVVGPNNESETHLASLEPIRRRHVLTLDKLHRRAPLTDEADAAVHDQETLCRIGSLRRAPWRLGFRAWSFAGAHSGGTAEVRHKVVLVAPGCGGFKASGTPAAPSPAAAWPSRAAHQQGARAANPAPATPSLATGPLCGGPFFRPHRHACAAPGRRGVRRCAARGHRSQRSSASAASPLLADPVRRC